VSRVNSRNQATGYLLGAGVVLAPPHFGQFIFKSFEFRKERCITMADGQMVEFKAGARTANGYLVKPKDKSRASLIVIQEWWGLNDHIKDVADRFAREGYTVLAPDLYDGKVTKSSDEAGKLMQGLDQQAALETLNGAVAYLKGHGATSIGVTGFCMGGSFALLLPCHNSAIKAAVPFYGDVPSDDVLKGLGAPILFLGAADDPWINLEKMNRLRSSLTELGKEGEVKIYDGVGHAFFNDTRPEAYNRAAAEDAWQRTKRFFEENL
jgi:carboxymethylenebutenolidase